MKKLVAAMLSGVVLASSLPMNVYAATGNMNVAANIAVDPIPITKGGPIGSSSQPSKVALEAAIKTVKAKITVPADYSEFNYYFSDASTYSDASWTMTWSTRDGNSQISISCDEDYHITSFSRYNYSKTETGLSKYLKKELKKTADDFIGKVAPETAGKLEYVNADFDSFYSGNYMYYYQRTEKGIPFPDNYVQVYVNSITGDVTSLNVSWLYDAKIPAAAAKLTKEEAAKLIKENMKMKLVYRSNYYSIFDTTAGNEKKAYLVYEPTQPYISVDANTGKVYLTRTEWVNLGAKDSNKTEATAGTMDQGSGSNQLTPEEITRIEELGNVISKEKAIKAVTGNSSLYLDKNLTSHSATLNKLEDGNGKSTYVWNISLNDPREINYEKDTSYYRAYANATVDAVNGKILNFYASVKSYYDEVNKKWNTVKVAYNKEKARAVFEEFLKKQANDRFSKSVLSETNNDYVVYYKNEQPVYGGYAYRYNRTNEGIEYQGNGIYGSVDGVTGKIYSFGSYWDENIVFESAKGAMTADKAMEAYLSKKGYSLKYEINQITKYDAPKQTKEKSDNKDLTSVEYEVRLVYRPDINPSNLSPFTGDQLDYKGEVYKEDKTYTYQDITDEKRYRNILLLADMNIGFEGEKFLPEQAITVGELNELMNKIGYNYYMDTVSTAQKDTRLITREEIAQTFISKLGLDKMAQLQGIYKTGFGDEASINAKYLGAVALAKGLGLMTADSNQNFNPKNNVTRYDAVELILNYIAAQKNGLY